MQRVVDDESAGERNLNGTQRAIVPELEVGNRRRRDNQEACSNARRGGTTDAPRVELRNNQYYP